MSSARGIFITLEGGEGAGKSTLARALAARLTASGKTVVITREPGGSLKAERIREVILSGEVKPYGPFAEAMMFYAARADHLAATIRPALSRGDWVICDRFSDSTRAYQGALGRIEARLEPARVLGHACGRPRRDTAVFGRGSQLVGSRSQQL